MINIISRIFFTKRNYILVLISIFTLTLFGQLSAEAQDVDSKCLKRCKRAALDGITDCKNSSKQCVRENTQDLLNVLDYCTESYSESCESVVNGNYESCITDMCGVNITEFRAESEFDPDDPTSAPSCSTGGDVILDAVLDEMVILANDEWEQAACDAGLCPLSPVFDGNIEIGCSGDLGLVLNGICVAETFDIFPDCESFWAEVNATSLNGLQFGQYENFKATQISGASGTQKCPFNSKANDGEDFECSYSGTGMGSASLKAGELDMVVESIEIKLRCQDEFKLKGPTLTQYSGNFTCKTSNPTGTATYGLCGGSCMEGSTEEGVVTYLQIPKTKNLSLDLGSTFECVFDPPEDPSNLFLDAFVPLFRDQIAEALRAPIKDTLNSIIPTLPFPPEACMDN